MEGAAEEVEGLITQTTDVGDYELVDLNTTTSATLTTQVSITFLHSQQPVSQILILALIGFRLTTMTSELQVRRGRPWFEEVTMTMMTGGAWGP